MLIVAAIFVSTLFSACAPVGSQRPSLEEDLAGIARFNELYLKAINDEDIDTLSGLTTEGHIVTPPSGRPVVGKSANDEVNRRSFERFEVRETWTPIETEVAGDWGFQRGTYNLVSTPGAGGETTAINGHFLRIYQRQPNGEWRMTRDMFNVDRSSADETSGR
jgi:ketosteroid isomerase-like protein